MQRPRHDRQNISIYMHIKHNCVPSNIFDLEIQLELLHILLNEIEFEDNFELIFRIF